VDETNPKVIKRKHPREGEKKKQGVRTKVQANKQHKKGGPPGGKGTTKNPNPQTLLQLRLLGIYEERWEIVI